MSQQPAPEELQALAEALQGQRPAIICYAKCDACMCGYHYDEPTPHPWAGPDDIRHAAETGQPEPTGNCGCSCARAE
ncbi:MULTISPECIES: hypothetical protein [unclassified Streptomyces]|uniref:hypothetical protein n=1 Tax=unclassified Streptomyces TaxID=2593676 RepID=UPI00332172ED